jgi:hypothetical protein
MPITTPQMEDAGVAALQNPAQVAAAQTAGTTTSQQLEGILNKGGALMQQAATTGNQQANSRGLLNSSMGIQAAQSAVLGQAVPIASSDASAINQTNQFNTQNQQRTNELNVGTQNDWSKFNAQNQTAMNQWNAGQQNEATLKSLDINSREQLANIEANYKQLMQVNSSAENMYNQVMKNISDIQMSDSVADKQSAINSQLAWLRSGMTMVQNLNGVQGLVTF